MIWVDVSQRVKDPFRCSWTKPPETLLSHTQPPPSLPPRVPWLPISLWHSALWSRSSLWKGHAPPGSVLDLSSGTTGTLITSLGFFNVHGSCKLEYPLLPPADRIWSCPFPTEKLETNHGSAGGSGSTALSGFPQALSGAGRCGFSSWPLVVLIVFSVPLFFSFPGNPLLLFASKYKALTSKGSCYLYVGTHPRRYRMEAWAKGQIWKENRYLYTKYCSCYVELLSSFLSSRQPKSVGLLVLLLCSPIICPWVSLGAHQTGRAEQLSNRCGLEVSNLY